jgi:amino acid transporter
MASKSSPRKAPVFVRDATGLRKNVTLLDAISINVSDMSAGAALANIGLTTILLPTMAGVNLVLGSLIAFVLIVPQVIIYTMMTRRMPRTGGDYVWVSRSMGGFLGNVLALSGYTMGNIPFAALIALSAVFAIGSVGVSLGYQNMLSLALPGNMQGANPTSQFLLASVILIVLFAINIVRPKIAYKLISIFTVIGIVSMLVAVFVLVSSGTNGAVNYVNSLGNSTLTYQGIASSYTGPSFDWGATLMFVPYFAFFTYPWVNAAPAVASEIKGKSALKWNVAVSAVVVFLLVTGAFGSMYYAGGMAFVNAALANPTLVYNYSFNFWTFAMGATTNPILSWIIGIGWILWIINILAYLVVVEGRYLMAQAFDRFLPSMVAYVSKYGSPVVAHLIDLVITIALAAGASFLYGTFVSLYGTIVGPMIYFAFVGVAAVIFAVRNEKGAPKVILGIVGVLSAVVFLWLTAEFLVYWTIWGGNWLAYGFIAGTAIVGAVIYVTSKMYHARRGLDISLVYKQLPPE